MVKNYYIKMMYLRPQTSFHPTISDIDSKSEETESSITICKYGIDVSSVTIIIQNNEVYRILESQYHKFYTCRLCYFSQEIIIYE